MNFIHKHRRICALILLGLALALAVSLMVFGSLETKSVTIFWLVIVFLLAGVLFFKGVPTMVSILTFLAVFITGQLLAFFATEWIPFPDSMDAELIRGLVGLLLVIVIFVLRLPRKVNDEMRKRLGITIEKAEEPPLEDFLTAGKKRSGVHYDQIAKYKQTIANLADPTSLLNASRTMRFVRKAVGAICFAAGLRFLLVFISIQFLGADKPSDAIIMGILVISLVLCVFGICFIAFGFLTALIITLLCAAGGALLWLDYRLLAYLLPRSMAAFAAVIFLTVWAILALLYLLHRRSTQNTAMEMFLYPTESGWKGVDLDLKELLPVSDYGDFLTVTCDWQGSPELLTPFIAVNQRFSENKSAIFAGFELLVDVDSCRLYFYCLDAAQLQKSLTHTLRRENASVRTWDVQKDEPWQCYLDILYPEHQTLLDVEAENMADMLEKAGVNYTMALRFGFTLLFTAQEDAQRCADAADEAGFRLDRLEDNTELVQEENYEEKFSHSVNISRENGTGSEQLKLLTADALQFARRFGGELYEWGMVEESLDEPDEADEPKDEEATL